MTGLVAVVAIAAAAAMHWSGAPPWARTHNQSQTTAEKLPTEQELARNWPMFRGPGGLGISPAKDVPVKWDGRTGEGILWQTPIAIPGESPHRLA